MVVGESSGQTPSKNYLHWRTSNTYNLKYIRFKTCSLMSFHAKLDYISQVIMFFCDFEWLYFSREIFLFWRSLRVLWLTSGRTSGKKRKEIWTPLDLKQTLKQTEKSGRYTGWKLIFFVNWRCQERASKSWQNGRVSKDQFIGEENMVFLDFPIFLVDCRATYFTFYVF